MRQLRAVTIVTLLLAGRAALAAAQGGMGGGMGRGEGMGGQGMGGGPRGDGAEAIVNRFEQMGELKPVLAKLDLSRPQKDSLRKIEDSYQRSLRGYARAARDFLSRGAQGLDSIPRLMRDAGQLRDEEWTAVRSFLPETMHAQLAENIARLKDDERARQRENAIMRGGMGGPGGMGRGGMRRPDGMDGDERGSARGITTEELATRFERMGELRNVLAKLDLSAAQRDSIGRIELACGNQLRELANTVRSFGSQGRPAVDSLRTLQEHANALRDREWAAVRAYLPEPLRGRFDENVNRVRDDEARREQDLRSGRGRRGDDMNGPPPAGEQGAREM